MRRFLRPDAARSGWRRKATAIVEFAVILPLLLTLLFGIIEFGWLFMVRQTLINASREGCRIAVLRTATPDDVAARIREVMDPLGFTEDTDWWFTATDLNDTLQVVTVEAAVDNIALTGGFILDNSFNLGGSTSMRKEGAVTADDDDDDDDG